MTATHSGDEAAFWASILRDPAHGPLPVLLLVLTTMSGLIDAVSILGLGRVFVANMTGNVVFIGFALAHAPGFSLLASVAALVGFLIGAFLGGILVAKFAGHWGLLLRNACAVQFCSSPPHSRLCCPRGTVRSGDRARQAPQRRVLRGNTLGGEDLHPNDLPSVNHRGEDLSGNGLGGNGQ
jgi:Protein of unknown function (DUF1275)